MKKFLSVLTIPLTALAVLTGAIALPLLVRPFYWAQIQALDIPARSGLTVEQLRDAFGDVMDYCLGLRPDFAAGVLPFSQEGASHFADVRVLFLLDIRLLAVSLAALLALYLLRRRKGMALCRFGGRGPGFWAGVLGCLWPGRTVRDRRGFGGSGLRPGICGVPHHLFSGKGQLAV